MLPASAAPAFAWQRTSPRSGSKERRSRFTRGATSSPRFSRPARRSRCSTRPPRARCGGGCATPSPSRICRGRFVARLACADRWREAPGALRAAGAAPIAHFYDWAGGLVWLGFEPARGRAGRRAAPARGRARRPGDACSARLTRSAPASASFSRSRRRSQRSPRRVKESFDPAHILIAAACARSSEPMQTHFPPALLENPDMAESEKILRACVHCGFCTATCPTYRAARRRAR